MPSACDASCASSTCVPPGTPPAAGAVGTYEGGVYSDCNTYRPLPSCYMRDYSPFCPVCASVIRAVLAAVPARGVDHAGHTEHLVHECSLGYGRRRGHHASRDSLGCGHLPEPDVPDYGGADRRLRNTIGHVSGRLGRSHRPGSCRAHLAVLYVDQPRRRGKWQRHRSLRRDRRHLDDQHQRQHHRAATNGGFAGARPVRQHERRRRRWHHQGREAARGGARVHRYHAAE